MEDIFKKLDHGTSQEKIDVLKSLAFTSDLEKIKKTISKLDDEDIQVRGEAFSSLILNKNKISDLLIKSLNVKSKYIRGYTALVLANRNDVDAISEIAKMVNDQSSMVRSCALGALGHLRAREAKNAIENCLTDRNLEVRKSALQAAIYIGYKISENKIKEISKESDPELERLLANIKKNGGPEGI